MTQEHPITPPPELVEQWLENTRSQDCIGAYPANYEQLICTQAARWGADQELEACCDRIESESCLTNSVMAKRLRDARRPKPPSLKEQALEALDEEHADMRIQNYKLIRSVLESLPD